MNPGDQQVYAAWVAACAAVVQAIAAAVAIWYSGKLARDSAEREKAVDEAATRRIKEANAAAVEQRRLDHEAAERARNLAEVRVFNEPLGLAIGLAESALAEVSKARAREESKAARSERDRHRFEVTPGQQLLRERFPSLVEQAKDAGSAAAIRAAYEQFEPFSAGLFQTAAEWLPQADGRIARMSVAIEGLREQIIHLD